MSKPIDLTTLANVKAWLAMTNFTASDELLKRLISACSAHIQSWLNRIIAEQDYVETRDGTGQSVLLMKQLPVRYVSKVVVNGLSVPARTDGGGYGYSHDERSVALTGAVFPRGYNNVTVTYTAGYCHIPYDIEQAAIDTIGDWFRYRDRVGKTSEAIEGQSISFVNVGIPARSQSVLNQYRNVAPL